MKQYRKDYKQFLNNKFFWISIFLVAFISYAFSSINTTIGIDDLEGTRYVGEGNAMLAAGRFGTWFWSMLLGSQVTPFISDFLAIALTIWAAVNIMVLFRRITNQHISMVACTLFVCVLLSYPLVNEIWEYTGTNYIISGSFLLVSFSLLNVYGYLHVDERKHPWILFVSAILMMFVCAGYESVVPVYIFLVFAVLALQIVYGEEKEKHFSEMMRQGIYYAAVLVVGLVLRVLVHQVILFVMGLDAVPNGATNIYWLDTPVSTVIKYLFIDFAREYVLKGIIYFPLTELLIAVIVFFAIGIAACRKHGSVLLLPGFGMLFSLIILSIVQGKLSPYRTCQVFGVFVAFVAMLLVVLVQQHQWKRFAWIKTAAFLLAGYLCLFQAVYLNYFLSLNHHRSEEEAYTIRQIGSELQGEYAIEKPVIFVGKYELSQNIQEAASISQDSIRWKVYKTVYTGCYTLLGETYDASKLSRKLPQTNVNSVLEWGIYAYNQEAMQNLFAYYGFDYVLADYDLVYDEACQYAVEEQMPSYPQNGYIRDVGEYIIVCLGEVEG